ncbi:hypothetical protein PQO03_11020 [Lentisphaera profundi]|uniref:B box-type domain-containing protein n=1 Tax=Lentisphaera profundi TaxID=1658616 RepID=A0ABY7VVZ6_9BACT|nr:hypothetical protein [Lentisphaera profundi]WDE96238.1 hypothetical protein PQO03_11020 [Lentisphaera profundi]
MSVADKVCLNHTDRAASNLCLSCRKPVCEDCVVESDGSHFCSATCAEGHARTNANMEVYRGKKKGGFLSLIIKLAIIGAIVYFGWQYKDQIMNMINKK